MKNKPVQTWLGDMASRREPSLAKLVAHKRKTQSKPKGNSGGPHEEERLSGAAGLHANPPLSASVVDLLVALLCLLCVV